MGPEGEKIINKMYQMYSKDHDISFEEFVYKIILDDENSDIATELWEKARDIKNG